MKTTMLACALALFFTTTPTHATTTQSYPTVGIAGAPSSSAGFMLEAVTGEACVGVTVSPLSSLSLAAGFIACREGRLAPLATPPPNALLADGLLRLGPNPSRNSVRIEFGLSKPGIVSIRVFDCAGRLLRTVQDGALPSGTHSVEWRGQDDDGRQAAPGAYFCRLQTPTVTQTRRLVVAR